MATCKHAELACHLSQLSIQAGFGDLGALHWASTPEAHSAFRQDVAPLVHYTAHHHTHPSIPEAFLAFQASSDISDARTLLGSTLQYLYLTWHSGRLWHP